MGDFDLAAFYDTISHELLLKTLYPRTTNDDLDWFANCLQKWSSDRATSGHGHGIPQGPLASDFLAECFLLPIDLALQRREGYTRYVDDVRLFGATEDEVRSNVIELERHCRERGLIPQTGKFAIKRAQSVQEAMGMLPNISDPQHEAGTEKLGRNQARRAFMLAIGGKPYRVMDKTRLRYVLYRAEPDGHLVKLILRLIPHHPKHADAFFAYLGRLEYRKPVERLCLGIVDRNPYPYVRGEAWHVLARYRQNSRAMIANNPNALTTKAIAIAKQKVQEKWYGRLPPPTEGGGVGRSCPPRRSPLVLEGPPASSAVDNWTLGPRSAEGEIGTLTGLRHQRAQSGRISSSQANRRVRHEAYRDRC